MHVHLDQLLHSHTNKWLLGPNWQEECNHKYVNMRFQMQHRMDETPKEFIPSHSIR